MVWWARRERETREFSLLTWNDAGASGEPTLLVARATARTLNPFFISLGHRIGGG